MPLLAPLLLGTLALAAAGPTNSSRPVVTGTLQVGHRLVASPGSWFSDGTIAYAYQWRRCDALGAHCNPILGAGDASYTPTADDTGHTIIARVSATAGTASGAVLTVASPVVS